MKQFNSSSKHTATLSNRGFYTILTLCGLIIAISAWVLWSGPKKNESAEDTNSPVTAPIITPTTGAMGTDSSKSETKTDAKTETKTDVKTTSDDSEASQEVDAPIYVSAPAASETGDEAKSEQAPESKPETKSETSSGTSADTAAGDGNETASTPESAEQPASASFVRPVSGIVITPFSGDELIYQPTLGDWRVHTGTDIAAEPGENVLAISDGTVREVTDDGMYGGCVVIEHASDLVTTYKGVDSIGVVAGQAVSAGEAIGLCAECIDAEAELEPHIHVEAARAEELIDVLSLIGEDEAE